MRSPSSASLLSFAKGSNSRNIELLCRRTQFRRQEHNQRRLGRRSKSFPCRLPFTNAKKMAAYINVSPSILRLYFPYKLQCNNTTVASRIIYIYIPTYRMSGNFGGKIFWRIAENMSFGGIYFGGLYIHSKMANRARWEFNRAVS